MCGEVDDGRRGVLAQTAADFYTANVRQAIVEHDQVRLIEFGYGERILPGGGHEDLVPLLPQRELDGVGYQCVVIDNKYAM